MKHKGFMLIEFVIYLSILSIIALGVSELINSLWLPAMRYTTQQSCLIDLSTAHDCLNRDLHMAHADRKKWKVVHKDMIIFLCRSKDVGWQIKNTNLIRTEGVFDAKQNKWHENTQSLMVRGIGSVTFQVIGEPEVASVSYELSKDNCSIQSEVVLVNRKLPWKIKK